MVRDESKEAAELGGPPGPPAEGGGAGPLAPAVHVPDTTKSVVAREPHTCSNARHFARDGALLRRTQSGLSVSLPTTHGREATCRQ